MASSPPDKQDMILAFGYETARTIVSSDGEVAASERADMARRFPAETMQARGLLAAGQPTARFGEAYNMALAKLRTLLTEDEKLELAQTLFEVCKADQSVEAVEVEVIVKALKTLGVDRARLAKHLRDRATPAEDQAG